MTNFTNADQQPNRLFDFSLKRPFLLIFILYLLAWIVKIFDSFIFRLDEMVGEAILTKGLGLLIVVAFLWMSGRKFREIGFHSHFLGKSLVLAGGSFSAVYAIMFITQLIILRSTGEQASFALTAVDPKTGMTGGVLFGIWMIIANLINSAMEEGLFRGVMIPHLLNKFSKWGAILISAGFFSFWHISWPLRSFLDGASSLGEAGFAAFGLMLATLIAGIVYGYLFLKTGNLWAPFLGHTINNTLLNMLFFKTDTGLQAPTQFFTFQILLLLGNLVLIPVIKVFSKRVNFPEFQPWGTDQ